MPIARYREDVQTILASIQVATIVPSTPLWDVAQTAEAVEGVTTLGQTAWPVVERTAQAVEYAAINTEETIGHATQQAGHAVEHAAVRTGEAIEHTTEHAGQAVEQAAARTDATIGQVASSIKHDGAALLYRAEGFLLDEVAIPPMRCASPHALASTGWKTTRASRTASTPINWPVR